MRITRKKSRVLTTTSTRIRTRKKILHSHVTMSSRIFWFRRWMGFGMEDSIPKMFFLTQDHQKQEQHDMHN